MIVRPASIEHSYRIRYPQLVRAVFKHLAKFIFEKNLLTAENIEAVLKGM